MPQKLSIMDNICQRNTISINISNGSFPCDPEISNQEKMAKWSSRRDLLFPPDPDPDLLISCIQATQVHS